MTRPKGAAKAAPAKKRAPKKARAPKKQAMVKVEEGPRDWPEALDEAKAEGDGGLFDLIESGDFTVKTAAKELGIKGATVYQWKKRYPRFAERLDEAVDIGIDMATDGYREITAVDRDSAAGAQVKMAALDKYLQRKRPERFHVNPFKPAGGGDGPAVMGVVLVPMKVGQPHDDRPVIEGTAVRVPAKAAS